MWRGGGNENPAFYWTQNGGRSTLRPQPPPSQCQPRYAYGTLHQNKKCNMRNTFWIPVVRVTGFEQLDRIHLAEDRLRLKCDGTRAETRFRLSAKRTSPFTSARAPVQSTTGSRGVWISGSNAGYTVFRGSVKSTGYPLHSPVSTSLPLPYVTVCHHISNGLYQSVAGSFEYDRELAGFLRGIGDFMVYRPLPIPRKKPNWLRGDGVRGFSLSAKCFR